MTVSPSGNDRISVTANTVNLSVEDNTTDAFTLKQAANEYITLDTNNTTELLTLGNSTTNPNTLILGGKTTVGTGVTIQGNGGVSIAGLTTANGGVQVGSAITLATNGNLAVTGILTAKEFVGVFTSAGGAGVGGVRVCTLTTASFLKSMPFLPIGSTG